MNTTTRTQSGARLPLMLLLGFTVLVAGVVVWLVLTSPAPPPDAVSPPAGATPADAPPPAPGTDTESADSAQTPAGAEPGRPQSKPEPAEPEQAPSSPPAAEIPAPAPEKAPVAPPDAGASPSMPPATEQPETSIPAKPAAAPAETPAPAAKSAPQGLTPKKLPPVPRDTPLSPSPDPALVQETTLGPLPRIGEDGRLPRQVYAKPFDRADRRPRMAIVVSGLGLSAAATESAIQGLPGSVTLAFAPYSNRLNEWIRLARAAGHEVLINVPMEPTNYPAYDPGPQTLLTSLNAQGNLDRLLWSLSRGTGYVGVVDFLGSRFTTSRRHMQPILKAINERGLLFLDSGSSPRSVSPIVAGDVKIDWAMATLTLDQRASRTEIDRKFGELEQRVKSEKRAIGIASPYPVSLERIATWVRQLEARGIAVAPVSALTRTGSTASAETEAKKK